MRTAHLLNAVVEFDFDEYAAGCENLPAYSAERRSWECDDGRRVTLWSIHIEDGSRRQVALHQWIGRFDDDLLLSEAHYAGAEAVERDWRGQGASWTLKDAFEDRNLLTPEGRERLQAVSVATIDSSSPATSSSDLATVETASNEAHQSDVDELADVVERRIETFVEVAEQLDAVRRRL